MNRAKRMIETIYYHFINVNPKNKFGGDCVIRAIAHATGQTWEQTIREMTELGIKMGFVCNDDHVIKKYLEQKGFTQCNEPRNHLNKKLSVKEFIDNSNMTELYKTRIVAIVGSHHVTSIIKGQVHDIWNCSDRTMHRYWAKKQV